MAETLTANYSWTKPDPGASANTWGATLNADLDKIDAQVFSNQGAITAGQSPVGSITMFAAATPPTGWLTCDGSSLSTTGTYAALFAILQYTYGGSGANFNLPNLTGAFPLGANATHPLGTAGGAATVTLDATMIPAHTHTATQPAHGHAATQPAHTHADAGHGHGVSENPHVHGSNLVKQGAGSAGLYPGGGFTISGAGNTDPAATGITINAGAANIQAAQPAITVPTAQPAITVAANTGGGAAHNNMPPYLPINFIIRYL
jgi:microcystin-dependent protein